MNKGKLCDIIFNLEVIANGVGCFSNSTIQAMLLTEINKLNKLLVKMRGVK